MVAITAPVVKAVAPIAGIVAQPAALQEAVPAAPKSAWGRAPAPAPAPVIVTNNLTNKNSQVPPKAEATGSIATGSRAFRGNNNTNAHAVAGSKPPISSVAAPSTIPNASVSTAASAVTAPTVPAAPSPAAGVAQSARGTGRPQSARGASLFLADIPKHITVQMIEAAFVGVNVRVKLNQNSKRDGQFGFADFVDTATMKKMLEKGKITVDGKDIQISEKEDKKQQSNNRPQFNRPPQK